MKFCRIVQAEQAAIHAPACSKFRKHSCQVAADALHSAGSVQFGEEANYHDGQSLPTAGDIGKTRSFAGVGIAKRDANTNAG